MYNTLPILFISITSDHNKEVMKKFMEAMDGQGYISDLIKSK